MDKKLTEIQALLDLRKITEAESTRMRAKVLGLEDAPAVAAPALSTIENETSKSRRELMSLVSKWIGSQTKPMIDDDLYETVFHSSTSCTDEELRTHLAKLTGRSRRRRELTALFREAGKGGAPAALIGDTATHIIARRSARDYVLELAAALLTSQATPQSKFRLNVFSETLTLIQDEETCRNATTIMANLRSLRKDNHDDTDRKRSRDDDEQRFRGGGGGRGRGRGGAGGAGAGRPRPVSPGAQLDTKTMENNRRLGLCDICQGRGHRKHECPSKK